MATRAITLLLLSFAFNKAYTTPVCPCGGIEQSPVPLPLPVPSPAPLPLPASAPAPGAPEVYNQNNGQPLVLYAYGDSANEVAPTSYGSALPAALPLGQSGPAWSSGPSAPGSPSVPSGPASPLVPSGPASPLGTAASALPLGGDSDLAVAQQLADQSIANAAVETIPAPEQPCKVETSTEVIHTPGETFVHQPGEILINQPPTRLIINHAPYIVRPSPIVLNSGHKTITNAYTRKTLPSSIQLRPVIVRIVRPIEKRVFIDKPAVPGAQTYASNPVIPDACSTSLALAGVPGAAASAGLAIAGLPAASPLESTAGLASAGLPAASLFAPATGLASPATASSSSFGLGGTDLSASSFGLGAPDLSASSYGLGGSPYSYGANALGALNYPSLLASGAPLSFSAAGGETEFDTDNSGSVMTALPAPSGGCNCA